MMKPTLGLLIKSKAEIQAECALMVMNSESTVYLHAFKVLVLRIFSWHLRKQVLKIYTCISIIRMRGQGIAN